MRPISPSGCRTVVSRGRRRLGQVDVVEAGHRQVAGHAQAAFGGGGERTDRDLVVEADDGGGPVGQVEQLAGGAPTELGRRLGRADQGRVGQHADVGQGRGVPGQP